MWLHLPWVPEFAGAGQSHLSSPFSLFHLAWAAILDWEGVWCTELTISLPSLVSPYPAFSTAEIITTRGARERGDKNQCEFG